MTYWALIAVTGHGDISVGPYERTHGPANRRERLLDALLARMIVSNSSGIYLPFAAADPASSACPRWW